MKLAAAAAAAAAATSLAACADVSDDPIDASTGEQCLVPARTPPARAPTFIHHGTDAPTEVPLAAEQLLALGTFGRCSGALVSSRWVLSARHCGLRAGDRFSFGGVDAASGMASLEVVEVVTHSSIDLALARLAAPAETVLPAVRPIPWLSGAMASTWMGRPIEGAGYGMREDGGSGVRKFVAEAVVAVDGTTFIVDGAGAHGLCGGDSGGPALVVADDATIRVAGALSAGSPTCVDLDRFARVDVAAAWIESVVGVAPPASPAACGGGFDTVGRCAADGAIALHCDDSGLVRADACAAGEACGWSPAAGGFRCRLPADPCDGVDTLGRCDGDSARWCEAGTPRQRDCAACGERCRIDLAAGGATCVVDPCAELDDLGRCEPDGTRVWCEGGERFEEDCAMQGATCRLVNGELGHQCAWS